MIEPTAFPVDAAFPTNPGLTKREYAAIHLAAALLSSDGNSYEESAVAKSAARMADVLLEELE